MMKVKFVGAIKGVTGSCSWLWHTATDTQILVDCGMHQGTHELEWLNKKEFTTFNPKDIQYVILTHAHIDHCGLLPKLIKEGFRGWVYCTEATAEIAKIMLVDAAKVSNLYSAEDVKKIEWKVIDTPPFHWSMIFRLNEGVSVTFNRGSHVLGGCSVSIAWAKHQGDNQKDFLSIHFTGDVGCQRDDNPYLPLLKTDHKPYPTASYIVTEATYGDRNRQPHRWEQRIETLTKVIARTIQEKDGRVLIPTFAFHRMQELIADLCAVGNLAKGNQMQLCDSPASMNVLCHSTLGRKLHAIYARQLGKQLKNGKYQYLNADLSERLSTPEQGICKIYGDLADHGHTKFGASTFFAPSAVRGNKRDYWQNNISRSDVILASSGMCDKGPTAHYLEEMHKDPSNTIIITGFQSAGSAGRALLESAGDDSRAEVVDMSSYYSGHADQNLLLDYLLDIGTFKHQDSGTTMFINHGNPEAKEALKAELLAASGSTGLRTVKDVHIASDTWFDLDSGVCLPEAPPAEQPDACLEEEIVRLRRLLLEAGIADYR